MMKHCPCGSVLRRHRAAIYSVAAGLMLAVVISQVGGILGIIAFFRTF